VLLVWSLPATWKYVTFMKREHSAYLHMRFDILYSIYLVFLVAVVVRHLQLMYRCIRPSRETSAPDEAPLV
jgi:TRAP-type C4-dicarboxylate transport system permease small subunit